VPSAIGQRPEVRPDFCRASCHLGIPVRREYVTRQARPTSPRDNGCEVLPRFQVELDLIPLGRLDGLDNEAVRTDWDRLSALQSDGSDRGNPVIESGLHRLL